MIIVPLHHAHSSSILKSSSVIIMITAASLLYCLEILLQLLHILADIIAEWKLCEIVWVFAMHLINWWAVPLWFQEDVVWMWSSSSVLVQHSTSLHQYYIVLFNVCGWSHSAWEVIPVFTCLSWKTINNTSLKSGFRDYKRDMQLHTVTVTLACTSKHANMLIQIDKILCYIAFNMICVIITHFYYNYICTMLIGWTLMNVVVVSTHC